MMRSAASTRSIMALSIGPNGSGASIMAARSLTARQASGEKRSRMTEAAARAACTSRGSEPSSSVSISTELTTIAGVIIAALSGAAFQF